MGEDREYYADNKKVSYQDVIRILKGSMACPKNLQGYHANLELRLIKNDESSKNKP